MQANNLMNQPLVVLSKQNVRQAWVGTNPPFEKDIVDILNSTNFSVAPTLHQKYEIVWLFEVPLSRYRKEHWRLVVDEAVRLLNEKGKLVVRTYENRNVTLESLKEHINGMLDIEASVAFEHKYTENNIHFIVFDIKRLNLDKYISEDEERKWQVDFLVGEKKIDSPYTPWGYRPSNPEKLKVDFSRNSWGYRLASYPDSIREEDDSIFYEKQKRISRKLNRLVPKVVKQSSFYKKLKEKIFTR